MFELAKTASVTAEVLPFVALWNSDPCCLTSGQCLVQCLFNGTQLTKLSSTNFIRESTFGAMAKWQGLNGTHASSVGGTWEDGLVSPSLALFRLVLNRYEITWKLSRNCVTVRFSRSQNNAMASRTNVKLSRNNVTVSRKNTNVITKQRKTLTTWQWATIPLLYIHMWNPEMWEWQIFIQGFWTGSQSRRAAQAPGVPWPFAHETRWGIASRLRSQTVDFLFVYGRVWKSPQM